MLPRIVLHKRNGHSHAPDKSDLTPGRIMLMVHSAPEDGNTPGHDLLRFATVVRSEKPRAFIQQATRQIDGLKFSIAEALAHTQEAFERGEMADVRAAMDAIRAQSQAAAAFVRALTRSLPPRDEERVVVDVAALLEGTLEAVRPHLHGGPVLVSRIEPDLPRLLGSPKHLQQALARFVVFAAEALGSTEPPARLVLEAVHGGRSDEACRLVEVRIGPEEAEGHSRAEAAGEPIDVRQDIGLAFACHVITAHRGVVSARRLGPGRVALALTLPAG